jgi:hypothetical protein
MGTTRGRTRTRTDIYLTHEAQARINSMENGLMWSVRQVIPLTGILVPESVEVGITTRVMVVYERIGL